MSLLDGLVHGLANILGVRINPATEDKQDTIITNLTTINTSLGVVGGGLSGVGVDGQTICTNANTWYDLPTTIPVSDYQLLAVKETVAGTVRIGFLGTGTPSATNGVQWIGNSPLGVLLNGSQKIYVSSSNAGDIINWSTKVL